MVRQAKICADVAVMRKDLCRIVFDFICFSVIMQLTTFLDYL